VTSFGDPRTWVSDAVFYQVFPDRFARSGRVVAPGLFEDWDAPPTHHGFKGGDLYGVADRLDYLADLGVTALYLTPIFASASNHRYHTYDYFRVDPLLGGDDALRELLDRAHARSMRVVLDAVFNHSGRGFWPFHHVVENGLGSPYLEWFFVDRAALAAGHSLRPYPSAAERHELEDAASAEGRQRGDSSLQHLGYRAWWDLPALPKLNTDNPQLREHLLSAAEHWLRFGIDGWRLDVAEEIDAGFWREFRTRVRVINPDAYIVAEIWRVKPEWLTGDTFDALMNYPLTEALLSFVAGRQLDHEVLHTQHEYREFVRPTDAPGFAAELERLLNAYRPAAIGAMLNLLGSHDTPRFVTVAGGDVASYRLAMLVVATLPGAPCIYYGDEVGMEGRHDPDCRRGMVWDEARWNTSLHAFVRDAIGLRHATPALRQGAYRTLAADGLALAYGRFSEGDSAVVLINAGDEAVRLRVAATELAGRPARAMPLTGMAAPGIERAALDSGEFDVALAGRSGAVLLFD
jgi:cyclomaltodextrinase